jgi:hypothetical protein
MILRLLHTIEFNDVEIRGHEIQKSKNQKSGKIRNQETKSGDTILIQNPGRPTSPLKTRGPPFPVASSFMDDGERSSVGSAVRTISFPSCHVVAPSIGG